MSDARSARGHEFVRPFIMTGGRTTARRTDLRFETLVARIGGPVPATVPSEQVAILELAEKPISVAELAAELQLVIGVVAVLINDLLDADLLEVFGSDPDDIELGMLDRIADKIRAM
jgi:Protein of unknown function (DUF742)